VTLARLQLAVAAAVWSAVYTDLRTAVSASSSSGSGSVFVLSHPMHNGLMHVVKQDTTLQRHVRKVVQVRAPGSTNSSVNSSGSRAILMQALKANSASSEHAHSALQLLQQHSNSSSISSSVSNSIASDGGLFNPVQQGDNMLVLRVLEHGHTASHIQEVTYYV
jgi:hypothetical protein